MADRFNAYPEYRKSGIEWISHIPKTWQVKPTFAIFNTSIEKNTMGQESLVLSLSYGNIIERNVEKNVGLLPESFNTYQIVNNGDLILRLTDLQNDKKSLRVGQAKQRGIITSAYLKLQPTAVIDHRFAYRLLHSYDTAKVFYSMGGGLRQSMKFEDFRRLPIILPPLEEQRKIADFLDHETNNIDQLISKQIRLLELLKEKRFSLVAEAVNSQHNDKIRLSHITKQYSRKFKPTQGDEVISLGLYNRGRGIFHKEAKLPQDLGESEFFYVEEGDLILSGQFAWEGSIALADESHSGCIVSHRYPILRGINNVLDTKYLWAYLSTKEGNFILNENSIGSAGRNRPLNIRKLLKEPIPVPPLSKQLEVARFVDIEKDITLQIKKEITLLNEHKTALISEVITGKIDVRDWQVN
jgi:type I restriction enzyme S subunit